MCCHEDYPCCGCGPDALTAEEAEERFQAEEQEAWERGDFDRDEEDETDPGDMDGDHQTALESVYGSEDTPFGEALDSGGDFD